MNSPLKFKIRLLDLPIKIDRKILVPDNISLYQFHLILQATMGWWNAHLYSFSDARHKGSIRIGIPSDYDPEYEDLGFAPLRDSKKTFLKEVFLQENIAKPFYYLYDFGDHWEHEIKFQKLTAEDRQGFKGIPICLEANGKCPPEDVGGVPGYIDFIQIVKDKNHPEYEEYATWANLNSNIPFDENSINLHEINQEIMETFMSDF